jgi:TPR repeat protein
MNQTSACPEVSAYRELMRGRTLPDCEALLRHLETCQQCRRTVQALDDWLLNASTGGAPESEARRRARQIAKGAQTGGVARTTDGLASDESLPAGGTLSPPRVPHELGRLGDYRVLRELGHGGMGVVYEAEDVNLGRRVALKVMRAEAAGSAANRERFLREARTAASIESDHVCPIYQVGEADGMAFIAMPLLRGEPLDARLRRERLPIAEVLRLGWEMAEGLAAAHEAGLVHRDIKPANVWLEAQSRGPSRVRLLDFGLARAQTDLHLTRTGEVMGTPGYFSPEQAGGRRVDGRSDLFSLGVVLYEMTTGKRPFTGSDLLNVVRSLALDDPKPPAARRPEAPAALSDLILQLLEKDPGRRADAAEVAARQAELEAAAPTAPATSYELLMHEGRPASRPVRVAAAPRRLWGRLAWAAVLGLVLALGLGAAGYVLYFDTGDGRLVVRVADDAEVRFAKGELRVYGDDGKLAFVLKPSEKNRNLPPGKYRVAVEGADGLRLDTDEFEMRRHGKVVVRVTAVPAPVARSDKEGKKDEAYQAAMKKAEAEAARLYAGRQAAWKAAEAREAAFQKAMKDARDAASAGRWADAVEAYDEALARKACDPAALAGRQDAQDELERAEALAEEEKAYRAAMKKAEAAMKQKKYEDAREAYAEALEHRPKDPDALEGDADASRLYSVQQFREAMDAYLGLTGGIDYERALGLFRAAAWRHAAAEGWVGRLTYLGRGTPKDESAGTKLAEEALPAVRRLAESGDADAQGLLGALLAEGIGVDRDQKKAVEWYQKAADRGLAGAMCNLGWLYVQGRGVTRDYEKGVEWLKKAADRGNVRATNNLGWAYEHGLGVTRDVKKAIELYEKAADRGDEFGEYNLGRAYEYGLAVERDPKKALEWYKKAAAQGHEQAKRKVKELEEQEKK